MTRDQDMACPGTRAALGQAVGAPGKDWFSAVPMFARTSPLRSTFTFSRFPWSKLATMGKFPGLQLAVMCVAAGLRSWAGVEGELVLLVTLTRHGSRVSEQQQHDPP